MIQKGTQYGLCDMHGKIILEPIYPRFPPPDGKFLYVTDGRHKTEFVMDLETGKRNFLPPNTQLIRGGSTDLLPILFNGPHKEQAGYASPAGVVVIEPKFVITETFSSNDLAKVRFCDRIT